MEFEFTCTQGQMANEREYVDLGISCADTCGDLAWGIQGKTLDNLSLSVRDEIRQLTTWVGRVIHSLDGLQTISFRTVAEIQRKVIKLSEQTVVSRGPRVEVGEEKIDVLSSDLQRIRRIFNVRSFTSVRSSLIAHSQAELLGYYRTGTGRGCVYRSVHSASSQLRSLTVDAAVGDDTPVRTEANSGYPTGSTNQSTNPPVTAAAGLGILPSPNEAPLRAPGLTTVYPIPDPSTLVGLEASVCRCLISRAFSPHELVSLIEEIFTRRCEINMIGCLDRDAAQTFIDVVHEVCPVIPHLGRGLITSVFGSFALEPSLLTNQALDVPGLSSRLRRKCLRALCWICGRHALLPKSLQIPLCYDRSDTPLYCGGFGDVWRVEHQGRHIAVKGLRVYSTSDFDKITSVGPHSPLKWVY